MRIIDIIEKKRDKQELTGQEIHFFVSGVTDGSIPDYQISALLMAILLNGMSRRETVTLTTEMAQSGDMLDLSALPHTVDKHSTGGVGDKTTLAVAPIAAALGCTVAKMSGRGLGFTGGTVDKLESITGYQTALSPADFLACAQKYGMCIVGQSGNFAPADKRLYAIRDVTATVSSIPLIASSIMSKKLAAGAETILLDVKFGSGAFMKTPGEAEILAREMVEIGKSAGRNTAALLTDMNMPLGNAVGNALEIAEAVAVLKDDAPPDLTEICLTLSALLYAKSFGKTVEEGRAAAERVIADGSALRRLCAAVAAQGGDPKLLTGEHSFPQPRAETAVYARESGYITAADSAEIGKASVLAGAGRERLGEQIDPAAGIMLYKKYGDHVKNGEKIAAVYGAEDKIKTAAERLSAAFSFGAQKPPMRPLIAKIIE